jgi:hypothetical protein
MCCSWKEGLEKIRPGFEDGVMLEKSLRNGLVAEPHRFQNMGKSKVK